MPSEVRGASARRYRSSERVKRSTKRTMFLCDFLDGLGVQFQVRIVRSSVREIRVMEILMGNRREDDDVRRNGSIVFFVTGFRKKRIQVGFEFVEAGGTGKGFVVSEKSKDAGGLCALEPIAGGPEVLAAHADAQFVTGKSQVSEAEVKVGKTGLDERFEPAVVLKAFGQAVTHQGDVVAWLQRDGSLGAKGRVGAQRQSNGRQEQH